MITAGEQRNDDMFSLGPLEAVPFSEQRPVPILQKKTNYLVPVIILRVTCRLQENIYQNH
jgi:hypothetical protein